MLAIQQVWLRVCPVWLVLHGSMIDFGLIFAFLLPTCWCGLAKLDATVLLTEWFVRLWVCVRASGTIRVLSGCSLNLNCQRGEKKTSKHTLKAMLYSLAVAAADAHVGVAVDQGRDGPLRMLTSIAQALTVEAARRTGAHRHRSEQPGQAPPHVPEVETLDVATIVAVTGGGGGVRTPVPACVAADWRCSFGGVCTATVYVWCGCRGQCQVLDPLVLNGAILLMLGSGHAKVAAVGLDLIRLMHTTTPVVEATATGLANGPGHVLFSNLVYQVSV